MANNQYGHPTRVDFLIDGVKQDTLVWDGTSQWDGSTYYLVPSPSPEGWVVSHKPGTLVNPPKVADSTDVRAFPSSPVTATESLRSDGKVGYKPVGSGTTSNWYEIVAEGDASEGDSNGTPYPPPLPQGQAGAQGDPHVTPIFGKKYSI